MKPEISSKRCPSCRIKLGQKTDDRFAPFCSERCKLVDLSKWFKGEYSIASEDEPDEADEIELEKFFDETQESD